MIYYALTITPHSRKPVSSVALNRSMDRYEKQNNVSISPRYFEISPMTKKRHVHALITHTDGDFTIASFKHQKNHNVLIKPVFDKAGWLAYASKDTVKKRLV